MKRPVSPLIRRLLLIALLVPGIGFAAEAGDLRIERPWSRATPPGAPVGAGYFTLVNTGEEADRLIGARSPVAGRVTIHRSVSGDDGTTSMEHQANGVELPAGARVVFAPGGYHLMLMQLEAPLEEGDAVPLTLRFERAGRVATELEVRGLTAEPPSD